LFLAREASLTAATGSVEQLEGAFHHRSFGIDGASQRVGTRLAIRSHDIPLATDTVATRMGKAAVAEALSLLIAHASAPEENLVS
jgi:hypothetical protein